MRGKIVLHKIVVKYPQMQEKSLSCLKKHKKSGDNSVFMSSYYSHK